MQQVNRRYFFLSLAGLAAGSACGKRPPRITQVTVAPIEGHFDKFVAMNSYDEAPKGETYQNTLIRVVTDGGVEGVGVAAGRQPDEGFAEAAQTLIGANPLEVFRLEDGLIAGAAAPYDALLAKHAYLDGPLLDLAGKLLEKPCWQLLGEPVRERVEVYDGTLYFADVWFKDRGVAAVVDEAKEAVASGYGAMKFKVGRGSKWMGKAAGLKRDIEVMQEVREAVGAEPKLLADANNGYRDDFDGAWTFLKETKDVKLHLMEEIFPEDPELYRLLRSKMQEEGMETLIADGESAREPEHFTPYLQPERLIDLLQMDIRRGGVLGCRQTARLGEPAGALTIPHNWASEAGKLMSLHLGRVMESVVGAEDDRSTCDALVAKGYQYENGFYTVSNEPGFGMHVNDEVYRERYQSHENVVS